MHPVALLLIPILLLVLAPAAPGAATDPGSLPSGNLRLVLGQAFRQHDLVCDLPIREGAFTGICWGRSAGGTQGRHEGTVEVLERTGDTLRLKLALQLGSDPWLPGGVGDYTVQLESLAPTWSGSYTGVVRMAAKSDWVHPRREVAEVSTVQAPELGPARNLDGGVSGRLLPPWPQLIPDHQPLQPGEHPRLALRQERVAALRSLVAEDPRAGAMLQRLHELAAGDGDIDADGDKFSTWPAIAHGLLWLLTEEARHAEAAWAIVERTMLANPVGPRGEGIKQDIHHGPRLVGLALVWDCCYAGWSEEQRQIVAREIAQRTRENHRASFDGRIMRGTNFSVWSNHNAIRMAAAGLGALALLGETIDGVPVLAEAQAIADDAARQLRDFNEIGVGGGGTHLEGMFYKYMTVHRGLGQAINAYRHCLGWDLTAGTHGEVLALGDLLRGEPGRLLPAIEPYDGYSGHMADFTSVASMALLWHLPTVPASAQPGVVQLIHEHLDDRGERSHGMDNAMSALYAFANYPFARAGADPDDVFPWLLPDPAHGHYVVRPQYDDARDILFQTNMRAGCRGSCHYERAGLVSMFRLQGYGARWLDGRYLPTPAAYRWPASKHDSGLAGPEVVAQRIGERAVVVDLQLDHAFMHPLKVGKREDPAQLAEALSGKHRRLAGYNHFVDFGWTGERSLLVDANTTDGVGLVLAVQDRLAGARPVERTDWQWSLGASDCEVSITEDGFRLLAADGAQLRVALDGVRALQLVDHADGRRLVGTGAPTVTMVAVLGPGAVPAPVIEADGIVVGERRWSLAEGSWQLP